MVFKGMLLVLVFNHLVVVFKEMLSVLVFNY
jgi:hypothetical protein